MDLCEKDNVIKKTGANSCSKYPPQWEFRDDGKEIYQALNSRAGVGLGHHLYGDIDYNGTLYVDDTEDNDWVGFVWGMLDIHNFYIVISNMQKEKNKACKNGYNFVKYNCFMIFVLIGVYWQIKRIQVSEDAIKDPYKFDKMIRALRSRKAVPKYSSVLWEVCSKRNVSD